VVSFRPTFGYIVGVDLGATSLDLVLADFNGDIFERDSLPIEVREGAVALLTIVHRIALEKLHDHDIPPERVIAFGIGVPGPVDFHHGMLIAPPIMPGWDGYPIRDFFRETFPNAVVIVDNDVNVMALGELTAGAGKNQDNFLFVKVGTGIGCGIVCRGEIYRGVNGCAGDIGHICADKAGPVCHCGNIGCLEAIAAGPPMAARATTAAREGRSPILSKYLTLNGNKLTSIEVGRAAAEGDAVANEIVRESGHYIGEVLAGLVNFFNPSLILIGGGVSNIGHLFLSSIRSGVYQRSLPLSTRHLRIDVSPMRANAGVAGAISLALGHVFEAA
jgi:glucokinase-like ROK family protein